MILEGLPTFVLGVACWWILADDPDTAYYLNEEEKRMILARRAAQTGQTDIFDWQDVRKGLKDWKIYAFCAGQFCMDTMLYGYSTFLPTIIRGIRPDASSAIVQVLTIPCYAVGAICYMSAARFSDWKQTRGPVVITFGITSVIGYALLISDSGSGVHYAGCFLVALGLYVSVGIPLAWLPSNTPRYGKRTTAIGLQLTIGNCSGIMASFVSLPPVLRQAWYCYDRCLTVCQLYPTSEGPRFVRGHAVTMSLVALGCVIYGLLCTYYQQENRRRAAGSRDAAVEGLSEEEIVALGDDSPRFKLSA